MKHYYSESEALDALNITDFTQINSSNFMEFAGLFKDIDPEVGKLALAMIPEFTKVISNVLESYKHSYDRNIEALEKSNSDYHTFCKDLIAVLSKMSEKTDITSEEKIKIIDALLELESRRASNDSEYRAAIREEREAANKRVDSIVEIVCGVVITVGSLLIGLGGLSCGLGGSKK